MHVHRAIGVSLVSGEVDSWASMVGGHTWAALAAANRVAYSGSPTAPNTAGVDPDGLVCDTVVQALTNITVFFWVDVVSATSPVFQHAVLIKTDATGGPLGTPLWFTVYITNFSNYRGLSIQGNTSTTSLIACGTYTQGAFPTSRSRVILTYNGGDNTIPSSYTITVNGVAQVVSPNGASGQFSVPATSHGSMFAAVSAVPAYSSMMNGAIGEVGVLPFIATAAEKKFIDYRLQLSV